MVKMLRVWLPFLVASALFAQKPPAIPEKAPPKVDAALRARVNQFFQYEIEGKFRMAEELVAEKDKDFFVAANKPKYKSFSIRRIEYSDNFTKATVVVDVTRLMPVPGFEGQPVPGAVPSRWKIERRKWCWYVDPQDLRASPMGFPPAGRSPIPGAGTMPSPGGMPSQGMPGAPGAATLPSMPNMAAALKPNKSTVELKSGVASSDQVTILNPLPSPVTLTAPDPRIPGLTVKLEHPDVKTGESAVLHVESAGTATRPPQPLRITVRVRQTNQLIPINVTFSK